MYDYLIVGSGFFGSVFARQMTDAGARCLVVEQRHHVGGNCHTEDNGGIHVHKYGPHIFHTNSTAVWDYVHQFATFSRFSYRPKVHYRGNFYSFPINLMTLYQLWGVSTPQQARERLEAERIKIDKPSNLEEWILSMVGRQIYETFIYGYTRKQWGRDPKELPASIIRRIPIRLTWNDDYFNDRYCGIPIGGYTQLFKKLLHGVPLETGADFIADREKLEGKATKIVYTGPLDRLFEYQQGAHDWRGLRFKHRTHDVADYQGVAAVNHTEQEVPYTRTVEHKHFEPVETSHTVVTEEYPASWKVGQEMYYPINDGNSEQLQQQYLKMLPANYIAGGRLASYRYFDMHQVIASALQVAAKEIRYQGSGVVPLRSVSDQRRRAA